MNGLEDIFEKKELWDTYFINDSKMFLIAEAVAQEFYLKRDSYSSVTSTGLFFMNTYLARISLLMEVRVIMNDECPCESQMPYMFHEITDFSVFYKNRETYHREWIECPIFKYLQIQHAYGDLSKDPGSLINPMRIEVSPIPIFQWLAIHQADILLHQILPQIPWVEWLFDQVTYRNEKCQLLQSIYFFATSTAYMDEFWRRYFFKCLFNDELPKEVCQIQK